MEDKIEKILVIEDDEDNLGFITRSLNDAGYDVVSAATGKEGLEKFRHEEPDLVVLDVVLPDIEGWEVLKSLRTDFKERKVPIIMLTVQRSEKQKLGGYIMGADFYIGKPFMMGLLLEKVAELLREYSLKKPKAE